MASPVFKTGLAAIAVAGGFDSLPPPPIKAAICRIGTMNRLSTRSLTRCKCDSAAGGFA